MKKIIFILFLIISVSTTLYGAGGKNRVIFCHNGQLLPESALLFRSIQKSLSRKRIELTTFDYSGNTKILSAFTEKAIKNKKIKGLILLLPTPKTSSAIEKICSFAQLPLVILGDTPGSITHKGLVTQVPFLDKYYLDQIYLALSNLAETPEWEDNTLFSSALFLMQKTNNYLSREVGDPPQKRLGDTILSPTLFSYTDKKEENLLEKLRKTGIKHPSSEIIVSPSEILPLLRKTLIPQGKWLKSGNSSHIPIVVLNADLFSLALLHDKYIDTIICIDIETITSAITIPLLSAIEKKPLPSSFLPLEKSPTLTITKNKITKTILHDYGEEEFSKNEKIYTYLISADPQ